MVESKELFQLGGVFFSLSLRCILTSYICKEPQITSLPQTLSALSPNTEKKFSKSIDKLLSNITTKKFSGLQVGGKFLYVLHLRKFALLKN